MKVKVHWIVDGIADVEFPSQEEARTKLVVFTNCYFVLICYDDPT